MNDFDVLSPFPFGWIEVISFYIIIFLLLFFIYKFKNFVLNKNNKLLDLIYLSVIIFCGSLFLLIFKMGTDFFIGKMFITYGNEDIIRYSSLIFTLYLSISFNIGKKIKK